MNPESSPRRLAPILFLVLLLSVAGCSDGGGPTAPDDDTDNNTPPLPTVSNPTDELPATSSMLAVEDALLGNFTPVLTGDCSFVGALNSQSMALDFRLDPGRCRLIMDGERCPPGNLKWSTFGLENWSDCVLETAGPCFEYLGTRGGSNYYGLAHEAFWMVQDLNCRLAGGDLVTFNDADENAYVHELRQGWLPGRPVAIGLYDWGRPNGQFAWRSGDPLVFKNWGGSEPNDSGGEYFGMMYSTNAQWNDYRGTTPMIAVMETSAQLPAQDPGEVPVLMLGAGPLYLGDMALVEDAPRIVRNVYWKKVFQRTLDAGATYSQGYSYTHGTSETNGMSFGYSIGIQTEVGWGPVSTSIEMEFHQDFHREVTINEETTVSKTYECVAEDHTVLFALWQLRERYTICDGDGEPWTDPKYVLDGPLPFLDQGLDQEYLQTIHFGD